MVRTVASNTFWRGEVKMNENQRKHGVSFVKAQYACADPHRVIARDITHSTAREQRFFCFGDLGDGIVTVRFNYRKDVICIFGAGYRRKGKRIYGR